MNGAGAECVGGWREHKNPWGDIYTPTDDWPEIVDLRLWFEDKTLSRHCKMERKCKTHKCDFVSLNGHYIGGNETLGDSNSTRSGCARSLVLVVMGNVRTFLPRTVDGKRPRRVCLGHSGFDCGCRSRAYIILIASLVMQVFGMPVGSDQKERERNSIR